MDDKYNEAIDLYMEGRYEEAINAMAQSKTVAPDVYQQFARQCRDLNPRISDSDNSSKNISQSLNVPIIKTYKIGLLSIAISAILMLICQVIMSWGEFGSDFLATIDLLGSVIVSTGIIFGIADLSIQYILASGIAPKFLAKGKLIFGVLLCFLGIVLFLWIENSNSHCAFYFWQGMHTPFSFLMSVIGKLPFGIFIAGSLLILTKATNYIKAWINHK